MENHVCTVLALILFGLLPPNAHTKKIPSNWKTCPNSNMQGECLLQAITTAIEDLLPGKPSLGMLPLEPLRFETLGLEGKGPVSINLTFFELDIFNVKTVVVDSATADWDHFNVNISAHFREPLMLIGKYKVNGKVLILPIVGEGPCNLTFADMKIVLDLDGKEMVKGGKKYIDMAKGTLQLDASRLYFRLDNLFNGDKALGPNMNRFLNENWKEVLDELRGPISRAFGEGLRLIANRIFHRIPISEINTP